MQSHRSKPLALLVLSSTLYWATGCADSNFTAPFGWGADDDRAELAKYGPTATQRIESLKSLAKEAKGYSPALQEQMAQDLSRRIQNESNALVRAEIVRTLQAYPNETSRAVLRVALNDPDRKVRVAACHAWADIGGPESVQLLGRVVASDTDTDVRLSAVRGLGSSSDPSAIAAISPALEDSDPALQFRAVQSLQSVTGEDLGSDVNAWRQFVQNRPLTDQPQQSIADRFRRMF